MPVVVAVQLRFIKFSEFARILARVRKIFEDRELMNDPALR